MNTTIVTNNGRSGFSGASGLFGTALVAISMMCLVASWSSKPAAMVYESNSQIQRGAAVQMWTADSVKVWMGGDTCWVR